MRFFAMSAAKSFNSERVLKANLDNLIEIRTIKFTPHPVHF